MRLSIPGVQDAGGQLLGWVELAPSKRDLLGSFMSSVRTAPPHSLHATNRVFLPFDDPALDAENGGSWGAQQNCLHLCRQATRMGIDDRETTPPAVRKLVVFVGCAVRAMLVFVRRRRLPQRRSRLPSSCQRMPARFSVVSI